MQSYTLVHVHDDVLLRDLAELVVRDRLGTAALLAHIGEVDARQLYAGAGYPSMHSYCVEVLRLSEDSAYKRIRAARAARQFPAIFTAVAEGRLHIAAVCLLASHLTALNADELIEAATHRRKFEIEQYLARRFGAPEPPASVRMLAPGLPPSQSIRQLAPGRVDAASQESQLALGPVGMGHDGATGASAMGASAMASALGAGSVVRPSSEIAGMELAPGPVEGNASETLEGSHVPVARRTEEGNSPPADGASSLAPGPVEHRAALAQIERYNLKVTIDGKTHEKLRYAQALLSHVVARGDIAQVLDRALEALILQLERQRFGATTRPRRTRVSVRKRHVPAFVRRAVWERDQGQCTFVSASGKRCQTRRFLEFDHVHPVARGGKATVDGIRLRCRAHNQYEAERAFGRQFMSQKRQEASTTRSSLGASQTLEMGAGLQASTRNDEGTDAHHEHST